LTYGITELQLRRIGPLGLSPIYFYRKARIERCGNGCGKESEIIESKRGKAEKIKS
jgi:hypothetical protein